MARGYECGRGYSDDEPLDAVLQGHRVEIHKQTFSNPTELEIGKHLSVMNRQQRRDRFQLDQYLSFDNHVDAKPGLHGMALLDNRQHHLALKR